MIFNVVKWQHLISLPHVFYKCSSTFTHNLTMNQVSADLSAYEFEIQHLPPFYWRTFGTALFWPADTFRFYTQPKQKWAQNPWAFPRVFTQTQTAVLSCPPFAPSFCSAGARFSLVREHIRGEDPAGAVCLPTFDRLLFCWSGDFFSFLRGGGLAASLCLCLLLHLRHQRWWAVTEPVFLLDYSSSCYWLTSSEVKTWITAHIWCFILRARLLSHHWTPTRWARLWLTLVTPEFVTLQNTCIWLAAEDGKAISSSNKDDNWTCITWQCATRS